MRPFRVQDGRRRHVQRLEGLQRAAQSCERDPGRAWRITPNYLKRVEAHEAGGTEARTVTVELLSAIRLELLGNATGATWLDHQLISQKPISLRESGSVAKSVPRCCPPCVARC